MKKANPQVYQFKIALVGITPQIWRRIQVPEDYTFWDLNVAIQAVMDWGGYHLHEFSMTNPKTGEEDNIGVPSEDSEYDVKKGWKTKIAGYFSPTNKRATYLYDFGDDWEHTVVFEKILPVEPGTIYPICIGGKRSAPPEDVGGLMGFEEFIEIMKDPDHEEHEEMAEWYGDEFDPEHFDCDEVMFSDPKVLLKEVLENPDT
ncbi:MAG: plasmid pRiA4b ORF-3 family protein [Methanoregula sp.]|jgi:hypothetical protein